MICKKEWQQFFSSITGYLALIIFLVLNGLVFFVLPDTSLLDFGYASLDNFFRLAPWIFLFLIPTITMRSFADEYKSGTFELLRTLPLKNGELVWGKYFGALLIVLLALLPTVIYAISIEQLSVVGGIDTGSTAGSYIGLFMLGAVFTAIGICASSFTNNTVVAFLSAAIICLLFYIGFDALGKLPVFASGQAYYIQMAGINFHYQSISKGVVDIRDIIYYCTLIFIFILITRRNTERH